jgi:hypothetical protein
MNNKKYNPEDYKDVEFITLGDGPELGKNSICQASQFKRW